MKKLEIPTALTIDWIREKYLSNELEPEDLILEMIERAQRDEAMNIWITPPKMNHIQPYLDRLSTFDKKELPLWGIPFGIKDNIDLADIPTTCGCPVYAYTPEDHATVVKKLIEAGAIPIGKTNMDQFATGLVGTRSPYGETHNAISPELISGGSSSGSAVAVARGQAVFSLGTDTAGSGRIPAALNNLIGFKPSQGAWSTKGVVPACASLDCVTVFSHCLDDALAVDAVVRGFDDENPWSRRFDAPAKSTPKKILLPKGEQEFFGPYQNEYQGAWKAAVKQIEKLKIPIEYIDFQLFSTAATILYDGPYVAERWADLGGFIDGHPGSTFPVTEEVLRLGASEKFTAAGTFMAIHQLQEYKMKASKLLEDAILITPTAGGTYSRDEVREDPIKTNSNMGKYTNHCNLLDLCAVAIQAGEAASRIPFGITIFGHSENESLIAGAAQLLSTKMNKEIQETTYVAVCGLHMRGFQLEKQMLEFGAHFVREAFTAEKYQLIKLPTVPTKPGLIKRNGDGKAIKLEIWEMPLASFGKFVSLIPSPLGIGKVELQNGEEVPGFICEGYANSTAEDITELGSWLKVTR